MAQAAPRPPYVEFEERAEEDRAGTIQQGSIVMRPVDYAILRALGSKDTVEKPALEWLEHIERQAQRNEYPREWVKFFRELYSEWKSGADVTKVNGLHVRSWAAIGKAQAEILVSAKVLTVEDLAEANEETLQRIGMGARDLKNRARAHIDAAQDGKAAEELATLRAKCADQQSQIDELNTKVGTLVAALEAPDAPAERPRRRA